MGDARAWAADQEREVEYKRHIEKVKNLSPEHVLAFYKQVDALLTNLRPQQLHSFTHDQIKMIGMLVGNVL